MCQELAEARPIVQRGKKTMLWLWWWQVLRRLLCTSLGMSPIPCGQARHVVSLVPSSLEPLVPDASSWQGSPQY